MHLADLSVDFPAVIERRKSLPEQTAGITLDDIRTMTAELYDQLDATAAGLTDEQIRFVTEDPEQDEEPGWNFAHVILHITASAEEGMALGSALARGAEVTGRSRYEPDWETVTTAAQIAQRLAESRRLALAFLETWPDEPHLDNTYEHDFFGPMTAISHSTLGLLHGKGQMPQVEEIVRQAKAAS
jgi:hypothetical protein